MQRDSRFFGYCVAEGHIRDNTPTRAGICEIERPKGAALSAIENVTILPPETNSDNESEWKWLREWYVAKTTAELVELAGKAYQLTDIPRDVLQEELRRRGLKITLNETPPTDEESPKLVTVREYLFLQDALRAKSVLDSAGIESFLFDEDTIRMYWLWSTALDWARLMVREEDLAAAWELLDQNVPEKFEAGEAGEYEQPGCPRCGSLRADFGEKGKHLAYATVAVGVPLPVGRPGWRCRACGHQWEDSQDPSE